MHKVLVARLASDEHARLVQALADEDFKVETCEDGEELVEALAAMKHDVFIVYSDLNNLAGEDAIVSQQKKIVNNRKSAAVFLVLDVQAAIKREEYQRCGVADILSPGTETIDLVRTITDRLFKRQRAAERHDVDMSAILRTADKEIACTICELSESGAGLVVPGKPKLLHSAEVNVEFLLLEKDFSSKAIVRRIAQQRRFVRTSTRVGLQLVHATDEKRLQFGRMLTRHLELEREVDRDVAMVGLSNDPNKPF